MKITLNWLRQYVDFDWPPDELSERLTMLGLEVEGVQKFGGEFEGVVVAQVVTKDKHPNADKLSLCRVDDGKGERQIVCGAHNFKPGDKVPLILPGASLPLKPGEKEPFTVKVGKIRGVESHGMMCSPKELGLADDAEGLLILREDAKVGQPFAEYLGRAGSDVVYDLEITPNRPDWNSVIGIAREIAAVTGNPLKMPEVSVASGPLSVMGEQPGTGIDSYVAVRLEDAELCPRYVARVIRGVKVGPSPDWLRSTLEKVGIRSISNVVDVTNYVMLETGQPLRAFDYHLVEALKRSSTEPLPASTPTIIVRRARDGEKFTTLDGTERTLTNEMLLIADEQKGIALAGIMGGQNSEIRNDTSDVLIESAYFQPTNIRRTSKSLGLRTESSYRFERGADIGITDYASQRTCQLILETAGGQLVPGAVDAYPTPAEPKRITLRHHKVNELLGVSLRPEETEYYLSQLGLRATQRKARPVGSDLPLEPIAVAVPSFRVDLKREIDLIEEVARLHGVDKVPATPPRGAVGSNVFDAVHDQIAEVRRILAGLGLSEAQGQTLISNVECGGRSAECVRLENPLSSEMDVLRPSLLPGLIHSLRHNSSRKNHDIALFEIGRVFQRAATVPASESALKEERHLAIALTGQRHAAFWTGEDREAKFDLYDLKGILEEFFEHFGMRGLTFTRRPESTDLFLESAAVQLGKQMIGEFGQVLPAVAKRNDLRDAVFLAELNLDLLLARRNPAKSFKSLPSFPSIRRDVAMIVPEATTHEAALSAVKQAKPAHLENVELFDVFRGQNISPGQKSMAYAFTYRSLERTLTDVEVNREHEKLVHQFRSGLHAAIRES